MLQGLPIALAEVKAGKTSENLLNENGQIIYILYRTKAITKKVYNNIMRSIKVSLREKCPDTYYLLVRIRDKTNQKKLHVWTHFTHCIIQK